MKATISHIFADASKSKSLSASQFLVLTRALERDGLDAEDKAVIRRIFYAARRGWLHMVR